VKAELLRLVDACEDGSEGYSIDQHVKEVGYITARLPPYHWNLNSIKQVQSQLKG
jgi:hypothetical protein